MSPKAFQDYYPDSLAHCYGCGRLNPDGYQIKSYWDGEESVCHYTPKPYYSGGVPGFAYGGIIASLIDCHGAATAAAAMRSVREAEPVLIWPAPVATARSAMKASSVSPERWEMTLV